MSEPTEYTLSADERNILLEIDQAAHAALVPFNAQSQAIIRLICRQQKIAGNVNLSADRTKLEITPPKE